MGYLAASEFLKKRGLNKSSAIQNLYFYCLEKNKNGETNVQLNEYSYLFSFIEHLLDNDLYNDNDLLALLFQYDQDDLELVGYFICNEFKPSSEFVVLSLKEAYHFFELLVDDEIDQQLYKIYGIGIQQEKNFSPLKEEKIDILDDASEDSDLSDHAKLYNQLKSIEFIKDNYHKGIIDEETYQDLLRLSNEERNELIDTIFNALYGHDHIPF